MVLQQLKRAASALATWSADPQTGLFTRNYGIIDAGTLDFTLNANVNDLNPAGLAQASVLRINPTAGNFYIAGIAGGVNGRRFKIVNVSTTLGWDMFNTALASPANQFITPRGFPIRVQPRMEFDVWYDGTSSKWGLDWQGSVTTVFTGVVVPTLLAGELGYVNVSLAGSALSGVTTTDNVDVNPQSDLAAAGAGNGGLLNWRVSALNTLRLGFVGALAGGAANFQVSYSL